MQINLAMTFNAEYVKYAYVMLTSLFCNKKEDTVVNLFVLHSDLKFDEQILIKKLVEENDGKVDFIFMNNAIFPSDMPINEAWPLEIYYRLMLPEVLPADIERVLYIDADVIINRPLDELYSEDFGDYVICACENFGDLNFGEYRKKMFAGHLEKGLPYVASGMLLMNLESLRKNCNLGTYIDVAQKFDYKLEMPDMDLLNYVHAGKIRVLDKDKYQIFAMQSYNDGMRYSKAHEPVIVHYAGHKPWQGEGPRYDIEQIWWDYAIQTPFYDEFTSRFVYECINSSYNYDKIRKLTEEKMLISRELEMRKQLCDKLLQMVENGKTD